MKNCPYCAEEIQDAAIVCKHCGRELAPLPPTPPAPPAANRPGWTGPVVLAGCLAGLALLPASPATVGIIGLGGLANAGWIAQKAYGGAGYRGGLAAATLLLLLSGGCWVSMMPNDRELLAIIADPTRKDELVAAKFLGNSAYSLAAVAFTAAIGAFFGVLLHRPR